MIIPFFIPHEGCPHQCVFCNQKKIIGQNKPFEVSILPQTIRDYLSTNTDNEPTQIAFYGGSFTSLPHDTQRVYLKAVQPFIHTGQIKAIRISTRPDYIRKKDLMLLQKNHVQTIELGVQSMDDAVLALADRGHTAADTIHAVHLLKEYRFTIGIQLMLGLPGDSADIFTQTIQKIIDLKPDFVRLYPLLVIKGTPLATLYKSHQYAPLSREDAVSLCRDALIRFEQAGIQVIRIGLQPSEELEKPGTILAGPYHPAFRQLVESSLFLDKMRAALHTRKEKTGSAVFMVNARDLSVAVGQRGSNKEKLKKEFGLKTINIVADQKILERRETILVN